MIVTIKSMAKVLKRLRLSFIMGEVGGKGLGVSIRNIPV
jgi:hypothetical protein